MLGPVVGDLPCQLGADGTARAGDADAAAIDQGAHGGAVGRSLRAAKQVFEADRADIDVAHVARAEVGQLRQAGERQSARLAVRQQAAEAVRVRIRFRKYRALWARPAGAEPAHDLRQLGRRPQYPDAVDVTPGLACVVVHDPDDAVVGGRAARRGADEKLGIVASPQQQHRYAACRAGAAPPDPGETAVQDRPVDDPGPHQERDQDEPVDEEGRAGIALQARQREQDRHEYQHREAHGLHDEHDVAEPRVAPDPAIAAHAPEYEGRDRREEQHSLDDEAARQLPEGAEPVAEQQSQRERRARHGHVVGRNHVRAADDQAFVDAPHIKPVPLRRMMPARRREDTTGAQ